MKFGLHYLLPCSDTQSPVQRYRDALDQASRGEALGFESAWPVEQHFNRNASIMPCPTLFLAALAERTSTMRLGTAIVQLPLSHPLRVAEEIATLDVLSGGRVEFGVGRGANPQHFAGFGVPLSESRDRMTEALEYLNAAFTQDRFSFKGRFFQADDISLSPRPVQRPHPPIRIAANSADSFEFAGQRGYPIFAAAHINPFPKLKDLLPLYQSARASNGRHAMGADDLTVLLPLYVAEDRNQVKRDVEPAVQRHMYLLSALLTSGSGQWTSAAEAKRMEALLEKTRQATFEVMNDTMAIFDTPEGCVERLRQVQDELNPGRVICWFNLAGAIPHDRVLRSMELFASKVLPHF